ncbi:hypothetical protein LR48_Vigan252s004500 [Vigna angularis]|uniref:Uncharacterized protein n=1 Tax=Phaseolus angularis TaxID=3914 RepID=A0A0L9T6X9_PHAAN|nr:hypothetical protein LR48_Vigan252s004500 [Vigna angularis]
MASSNRPSGESKGKEVETARGSDPSSWISDDEARERFLDGRVKIVVPPKYLNLSMFEREDFQFPRWLETLELSTFVQMKGDWYPDLAISLSVICCFCEEDSVNSSGSTLAVNEERTNFFPETNFERFATDQFRILIEKVNQLERKFGDA